MNLYHVLMSLTYGITNPIIAKQSSRTHCSVLTSCVNLVTVKLIFTRPRHKASTIRKLASPHKKTCHREPCNPNIAIIIPPKNVTHVSNFLLNLLISGVDLGEEMCLYHKVITAVHVNPKTKPQVPNVFLVLETYFWEGFWGEFCLHHTVITAVCQQQNPLNPKSLTFC